MNVKELFLDYVSYPTMSCEQSETCPSSDKQWELAKRLYRDLRALGLEVFCDEHGYVYGTLAANCDEDRPVIGLIAHMDTSDACADAPIKAREVLYDGCDIVLNEEANIVLSERDYPGLAKYRGKHLIVTDGTTLLGADDKAGCAEIVCAIEALIASGKPHGIVKVAFTPDEEIGRGADLFDVAGFGADYAYTVDGGSLGGIEYENFNAAGAEIVITGRSIHPGDAKHRMVNAALLACEINALLPTEQIPAMTEGYEGFFHLTDLSGDCEHAELRYIIRDHDRALFEEKKAVMTAAVEAVNAKWRNVMGADPCQLTLRDSYYNMKEMLADKMYIVARAAEAMRANGITPEYVPIRGGTDGARLSFEGLPCPNLSTGGENYHSRFEYACVEDMETMVRVLVNILED